MLEFAGYVYLAGRRSLAGSDQRKSKKRTARQGLPPIKGLLAMSQPPPSGKASTFQQKKGAQQEGEQEQEGNDDTDDDDDEDDERPQAAVEEERQNKTKKSKGGRKKSTFGGKELAGKIEENLNGPSADGQKLSSDIGEELWEKRKQSMLTSSHSLQDAAAERERQATLKEEEQKRLKEKEKRRKKKETERRKQREVKVYKA
jgi:hypothetical protein